MKNNPDSSRIPFDKSVFKNALDKCIEWAADHKAEVGMIEMALGAAVLSWGVMNGQIVMGSEIVASKLADIGGATGAGVGAVGSALIAATFLKGIFVGGVVGVAGVTAIPAIALIGGGSLILGAFGYVAGDKLASIFQSPLDYLNISANIPLLAIGLALFVDGARRVIGDDRIRETLSSIKDGVVSLSLDSMDILATTQEGLKDLIHQMPNLIDELPKEPVSLAVIGSSTVAGVAVSSALAAGSVTVLGSHGLGAVALSLGLVSAPVWPLVAGGVAGLAVGVAAWKGIKHLTKAPEYKKYNPPLIDGPK